MNSTNGGEDPQGSSWYKKWHDNPNHHLVHWVLFLGLGAAILAIVVALSSKQVQVALDLSSANTGTDKAQEKVPFFVQIPDRSKHADLVVSGKVLKTSANYETTDVGKVIVTHATVAVNEWLKGSSQGTIDVEMLGGTAPDGMTLDVSEEPALLNQGDQAIMFLQPKDNGHFAAAETDLMGKGSEIMKLNSNGTTKEGNLTSAQVKAQIGGVQ